MSRVRDIYILKPVGWVVKTIRCSIARDLKSIVDNVAQSKIGVTAIGMLLLQSCKAFSTQKDVEANLSRNNIVCVYRDTTVLPKWFETN
jgi:hypothetical protein